MFPGHRVIEIGCTEIMIGNLLAMNYIFTKSERDIDPGAVAVHGYQKISVG